MSIKLQQYRERAGLTQEQLGAKIGKTQIWVSRLERKERPKLADVEEYVTALGLDLLAVVTTREQAELVQVIASIEPKEVQDLIDLVRHWRRLSPGARDGLVAFLSEVKSKND